MFLTGWPRSGMTRNGQLYRLPVSERRTKELASSSLPTPAARDYRDVSSSTGFLSQRASHQPSLATETLNAGAGGERIAQTYLWAMGFPSDWLDGM